ADLPDLAEYQNLSVDDLFVLLDGMQLLGFAHVGGGDVELTAAGKAFSNAEMDERKAMFANHLLQDRPNQRAPPCCFLIEREYLVSEVCAMKSLVRFINGGLDAGQCA